MLFGLFIWQGTRIVRQTNHAFGYFLGMGIVMMLGLQAVVNVGVSIGAFPTKGLPLPFISYGGSALIFHLMAIALLLNISKTTGLLMNILIATGGTGGHIFPAIETAKALRVRGHQVSFAGVLGPAEEKIKALDFPVFSLAAKGLNDRSFLGWLEFWQHHVPGDIPFFWCRTQNAPRIKSSVSAAMGLFLWSWRDLDAMPGDDP